MFVQVETSYVCFAWQLHFGTLRSMIKQERKTITSCAFAVCKYMFQTYVSLGQGSKSRKRPLPIALELSGDRSLSLPKRCAHGCASVRHRSSSRRDSICCSIARSRPARTCFSLRSEGQVSQNSQGQHMRMYTTQLAAAAAQDPL